ncbi:short-chain dehydrogenase protein (plasmid) [Rhizobium gallicum]|uniref:Short-chain dehydrogenase protein n=1 Tax=Rhizobium gallicum TaxID=56730 RepID=A0A1L5NS23_9HYPH|nr:SDR family NAD(P)-dependent oxidoreductase [Rhizobium gallicum]APO70706.1 short-chain dehydrogenase protein [Rhizobium gallicum]
MSIRFDGKVAIVTGAGAGLGRAHALLLASRGAKVVVNDPGGSLDGQGANAFVADQVVEEIRAAGGEAVANYASVADRAGAASIVQTALNSFGGIHIVLNNAGILRDKSFRKMPLEDFELVMQVHFMGTVYVTHAAWPHLLDQSYGRVVLTSSASGLANSFGQSNYASAKAAMLGLMNCLKNEGSRSNVKVNMVAPVATTRMTEGVIAARQAELSKPERVSPAVAWLCSEACDVSGVTVVAGAGYYGRAQMMKGSGAVIRPGETATIEEFAETLPEVMSLDRVEPFNSTLSPQVRELLGIEQR